MKYTIATKWNELNDWQLGEVAKVFFTGVPESQRMYRLVYILFGVKRNLWRMFKLRYLSLRVPFKELSKHCRFLLLESDRTIFPKVLTLGTKKLYGPSDRLSSISIEQFSLADVFYYMWAKKYDVKELNRLVSVLYLPKGVTFDKSNLSHSVYVELMPLAQKLSVVLAYIGTRNYFRGKYKHVFPPSDATAKGEYHSFSEIIVSMARSENQPFGGYYETAAANAIDFLKVYNEELKSQKQKKRANNGVA